MAQTSLRPGALVVPPAIVAAPAALLVSWAAALPPLSLYDGGTIAEAPLDTAAVEAAFGGWQRCFLVCVAPNAEKRDDEHTEAAVSSNAREHPAEAAEGTMPSDHHSKEEVEERSEEDRSEQAEVVSDIFALETLL